MGCGGSSAGGVIRSAKTGDTNALRSKLQGADAATRARMLGSTDSDGWTALHHAAFGGHVAASAELLKQGADPNAAARDGTTPLLLSAQV